MVHEIVGEWWGRFRGHAREEPLPTVAVLDIQARALIAGAEPDVGRESGLIHAEASSLPLHNAAVDRLYLAGELGEIADRQAALREFRRVLRPGGLLSISAQRGESIAPESCGMQSDLLVAGFVEETGHGTLSHASSWRRVA